MPRVGDLTYSQIRTLVDAANDGDTNALRQLQLESARLAKRANVRLKALEDKNFMTPARKRAESFLDIDERSRFSESKKLTGVELEQQLDELQRFLNVEKGSTIAEAREYLSGIETLQNKGIIDEFSDDADKRAFLRFLESDFWNEFKSTLGKSRSPTGARAALQAAQDAIAEGAKISQLEALFDDFKNREYSGKLNKDEDFLSVFEDWTGVEFEI